MSVYHFPLSLRDRLAFEESAKMRGGDPITITVEMGRSPAALSLAHTTANNAIRHGLVDHAFGHEESKLFGLVKVACFTLKGRPAGVAGVVLGLNRVYEETVRDLEEMEKRSDRL